PDADADEQCRGHSEPIRAMRPRASLSKDLGVDLTPHDVQRHLALVGRRIVGVRRVLQQIVQPIGAFVGHDSYSLAKSASAARSCDRAADRRLLHVPSATPRTAAISVWV